MSDDMYRAHGDERDNSAPPAPAPIPTEPILQFFNYEHLPPALQVISKPFGDLARAIVAETPSRDPRWLPGFPLPRNAERTVALRKLLEAKDAAVRAYLSRP